MTPPPRIDPKLAARLARIPEEGVRETLEECLAGEASPPITLARLLLGMDSVEEVEDLLASVLKSSGNGPLNETARLLREHRMGCEDAMTILHEHPDLNGPRLPFRKAIAECRSFFDQAVELNEEASVAAYCLGDPSILDACTREVVDLFESWRILGPDRTALEIGCGIGRVLAPLAPRLKEIHGIDISSGMIAAARRRCVDLPNVHLVRSSGRDLDGFADRSLDLVFACDSFPYIYQGGTDLVMFHFAEVERVLRPGGDFVLLNYSYRASREADLREVERLAGTFGFDIVVAGGQPFRLWDAESYHLRLR